MSILWTIIIGFVAGLIAKFLHPGNKNEPSGFILTTLLGIAGAFVATFLWPSDRVVQSWGRCWFHRSNRWCNRSAGSLGDLCKSSRPRSLRNRTKVRRESLSKFRKLWPNGHAPHGIVEDFTMAEINKLPVGQVLDKLRSADVPKSKITRLDEKTEALEQEIQRLRAARRRLERNQRPGSTKRD